MISSILFTRKTLRADDTPPPIYILTKNFEFKELFSRIDSMTSRLLLFRCLIRDRVLCKAILSDDTIMLFMKGELVKYAIDIGWNFAYAAIYDDSHASAVVKRIVRGLFVPGPCCCNCGKFNDWNVVTWTDTNTFERVCSSCLQKRYANKEDGTILTINIIKNEKGEKIAVDHSEHSMVYGTDKWSYKIPKWINIPKRK